MDRSCANVAVTGGAGFIGSNFIRFILEQELFQGRIINIDKLTYAGNLENLAEVDRLHGGKRYHFEQADICNHDRITEIMRSYDVDTVIHFAAESHVDRSILGPAEFVTTNVMGTFTLLEAARARWKDRKDVLFHHVSTDEVFGSLGEQGYFNELTPYDPRSPYSASKASSDHLVRAYHHTYGVPVTISNCSNNYGPYQFPEKLIPVMILNILEGKPLPVYGDGRNIRDWLYVEDHSEAIWAIIRAGTVGDTYVVGGENEWENITLVNALCEKVADAHGKEPDHFKSLITFVKDRPGHDRRYAIDPSKIKSELGWKQRHTFSEGLDRTIAWYEKNGEWINHVRTGEYQKWMEDNYQKR